MGGAGGNGGAPSAPGLGGNNLGGSNAAQDDAAGGDGGAPAVANQALAVMTARAHYCVLLEDHHLKCWGSSVYGQLGQGNDQFALPSQAQPAIELGEGRLVMAASVAMHATCALLDDGAVKCWGWSEQIGVGRADLVGDGPGEMGDALPPLPLGEGRKATLLAVGSSAGCAVLDDSTLRCWNRSIREPVSLAGQPEIVQLASGYVPYARYADGSVGDVETGHRLPLPEGARARYLAGEEHNLCVLSDDDSFTCEERRYEAPKGASTLKGFALFSGGEYCTLDDANFVSCSENLPDAEVWAVPGSQKDSRGYLLVNLGAPVLQLSSGGDHYVCAMLEDRRVKCFGDTRFLGQYLVNGEIQPVNVGSP